MKINNRVQKCKKRRISQKNSIESYFGKAVAPIYNKRLREEIAENISVNNFENDAEKSCELNSGNVNRPNENTDALYARISALEKTCEELTNENEILKKTNVILEKENAKQKKDNGALKKLLDSSKSMNLLKDLKIEKLKTLTLTQSVVGDTIENNNPMQLPFREHEMYFSSEQMLELRSIGKGKARDSSFITKCLTYFYGGSIDVIAGKCSGPKRMKGKTCVSPDKKSLMGNMLNERVECEGVEEAIFLERTERLNRLIGDGIYNIVKRHNTGSVQKKVTSINHNSPEKPPVTPSTADQTPSQQQKIINQPFDAFNFVTINPFAYQYNYN